MFSTISFVNVFERSVFMTEQLAFKTTKKANTEQRRKDGFRMAQAKQTACWLTLNILGLEVRLTWCSECSAAVTDF